MTAAVQPAVLFSRMQSQERILWEQPSQELSMVAFGVIARLTSHGTQRFAQISADWRGLLSRTLVDAPPVCPLPAPVGLGGFAFDPARRADSTWEGYPDALLVLPRFLFVSYRGLSWLCVHELVAAECDTHTVRLDGVVDFLSSLQAKESTPEEPEPPESLLVEQDEMQAVRWKEKVRAIVGEITSGKLEKLVLARSVHACSPRPLNPGAVVRKLRSGYGHCTLFAFTSRQGCFIGATPERLVRLEGRTVRTDCLAGSTRRGTTDDEDRAFGQALLADGKERREHALVRRALRNVLEPLCAQLSAPEDRPPELRHIGALQTIDQTRLYESHLKWFIEMPLPDAREDTLHYARTITCRAAATARGDGAGPVHINFPFREPLLPTLPTLPTLLNWQPPQPMPDGGPGVAIVRTPRRPDRAELVDLAAELRTVRRGLIVCGPQEDPQFPQAAAQLAQALDWPLLADPLSQTRCGSHHSQSIIDTYDAFLRVEEIARRLTPERVLRFGATPVSKPLVQYLQRHAACRQILIEGDDGWQDPALTASEVRYAHPRLLCETLLSALPAAPQPACSQAWKERWIAVGRQTRASLQAYFQHTQRDSTIGWTGSAPLTRLHRQQRQLGSSSRSLAAVHHDHSRSVRPWPFRLSC